MDVLEWLIIGQILAAVVCTVPLDSFYEAGHANCLPPNDDSGYQRIDIGDDFSFFQDQYRQVYVCTNGLVSFNRPVYQYTSEAFPKIGDLVILAPFWADIDTRERGKICWKSTSTDAAILHKAEEEILAYFPKININVTWVMIATWTDVPPYRLGSEKNTFQAVLILDGQRETSFVLFNYNKMKWSRGLPQVGFNKGDDTHYYSVEGSRTDDIINIVSMSNVHIPGKYAFRVDLQEIKASPVGSPHVADVLFVIDSSYSEEKTFQQMLEFIVQVIDQLAVSPNETHIAAVSFSNTAIENFDFTVHQDRENITALIRSISHVNRTSYMDIGLRKARDVFQYFSNKGTRYEAEKIVVLLSDGLVNKQQEAREEAAKFRTKLAEEVKIFAVGFGNSVHHLFLESIAFNSSYILAPRPERLQSLIELQLQEDQGTVCSEEFEANILFLLDVSEGMSRDQINDVTFFLTDVVHRMKQDTAGDKIKIAVAVFDSQTKYIIEPMTLLGIEYQFDTLSRIKQANLQVDWKSVAEFISSNPPNSYNTAIGTPSYVVMATTGSVGNESISDIKILFDQIRHDLNITVVIVGFAKDTDTDWSFIQKISNMGYYKFNIENRELFERILLNDIRNITCVEQ